MIIENQNNTCLLSGNSKSNTCNYKPIICTLALGVIATVITTAVIYSQPNSPNPSLRSDNPTSDPSSFPTSTPSLESNSPTLSPTPSLRSESPTSIPFQIPTSTSSASQLTQINDTPDYLKLTASSTWGTGVNCYTDQKVADCFSTLNPQDAQVIGVSDGATSSGGLGVDYDVYKDANYKEYINHIHINYNEQNGVLSPDLTNNGGGAFTLEPDPATGYVYIRQAAPSPTQSPTTAPPTISQKPSLRPTLKPSSAPSIPTPTVSSFPTPSSNSNIEQSAWYIDWTSWFNGAPYPLPEGVNLINVFVGEFTMDENGNPTLGGFGNLDAQISDFASYCKSQNIAVKVSIGGGGGSYDNTWDNLTSENVQSYAQAIADYCHTNGLAGVDIDYEEFKSSEQESLVGTLMREVKEIDSELQVSLCSNAGLNWQPAVQTILDSAVTTPGKCPLDRLYIMSYYDPIEQEESWITDWASWIKENYNCDSPVIGVGIDDFDAHAYDPEEFKSWALSNGYSTAHWAFDPAHPTRRALRKT